MEKKKRESTGSLFYSSIKYCVNRITGSLVFIQFQQYPVSNVPVSHINLSHNIRCNLREEKKEEALS